MDQNYSIAEWAEKAAAGALSAGELHELQMKKNADSAFAAEFDEMHNLITGLSAAGRNRRYRMMLSEVATGKNSLSARSILTQIISLPYLRTAAVAAGIALLTSTIAIGTMQHHAAITSPAGAIQDLRREVKNLKQNQRETEQKIASINKDAKEGAAPALPSSQYGGTGFALTNDGYLITSYHVTDGADSLYVQTRSGRNYKAHVVAFESSADVAVLKIEKDGFRFGKGELPYTFAATKSSLGARVYSLGFPQDEIVYNEGYIASRNGYEGDSSQYRLEIAAGPGQSGSPVVDERGNIIAIIKSKDMQSTYAVSSRALLHLLKDLPKGVKLSLPRTNHLAGLSREQQIESLQDYTCVIKVFGK